MPTSGRNNLYFKIKSLFKSFPVVATEGFTLIELLIVVAITGILSTVILANYNSFGARQEVRNVAEEFKTELRKYQIFAIAGHKNPDQSGGCVGELISYEITVISSSDYEVVINCDAPTTISTVTFPTGISVSTGCIRFLPLNRGTEICGGSSPLDISFTGDDGTTYIVTVNESGEIQLHR